MIYADHWLAFGGRAFLLLFAGLIVAGLIVLQRRFGWMRFLKGLVAIAGVAAVFSLLAAVWIYSVSRGEPVICAEVATEVAAMQQFTETQNARAPGESETGPSAPVPDTEPRHWADLDPRQFPATTYPDYNQAITDLSARAAAEILAGVNGTESDAGRADPPTASVEICFGKFLYPQVETRLQTRLATLLPSFEVQLRAEQSSTGGLAVAEFARTWQETCDLVSRGTESGHKVYVFLSQSPPIRQPATWAAGQQQVTVSWQIRVASRLRVAEFETTSVSKPWVSDLDQFLSQHPTRNFVVGYSKDTVISDYEAHLQALTNANSRVRLSAGQMLDQYDETFVIDRFTQKIMRPYGEVWREALLLEVIPERVASTTQRYVARETRRQNQQRQQHEEHQSATWHSIMTPLGLLGGTGVLCWLLNYLTQGYYQRRLLVAGFVVVLCGLLVIA